MGPEQQPGSIRAQLSFPWEAEVVLSLEEWTLLPEHHSSCDNPGVAEQKLFPRQEAV